MEKRRGRGEGAGRKVKGKEEEKNSDHPSFCFRHSLTGEKSPLFVSFTLAGSGLAKCAVETKWHDVGMSLVPITCPIC